MKTVIQFFVSAIIFALVIFGVLHLMGKETGEVMDWIIGLSYFLMAYGNCKPFPWNAHFKAKEVLDDAEISKRKKYFSSR